MFTPYHQRIIYYTCDQHYLQLCVSADGRGGGGADQREGMGLLEYQTMPALHDVAHDVWLGTFTI
jgi:hypothetical protein